MTMQENGLTTAQQQAIENLYRAFNEQNPDLLDLAVTADWQDIPLGPGQQPGRDGMRPIVAMFVEAFPDVKIAIHEFHHLTEDRITHTWHLEDWFAMLNQVDAWPPR